MRLSSILDTSMFLFKWVIPNSHPISFPTSHLPTRSELRSGSQSISKDSGTTSESPSFTGDVALKMAGCLYPCDVLPCFTMFYPYLAGMILIWEKKVEWLEYANCRKAQGLPWSLAAKTTGPGLRIGFAPHSGVMGHTSFSHVYV